MAWQADAGAIPQRVGRRMFPLGIIYRRDQISTVLPTDFHRKSPRQRRAGRPCGAGAKTQRVSVRCALGNPEITRWVSRGFPSRTHDVSFPRTRRRPIGGIREHRTLHPRGVLVKGQVMGWVAAGHSKPREGPCRLVTSCCGFVTPRCFSSRPECTVLTGFPRPSGGRCSRCIRP